MKYVNVTIDNKSHLTDDLYTYRCAFDEVRPGSRVRVAFGRGKALKDAYVFDVMDELPAPVKGLKDVAELTEDAPLGEESMELARWMHSRYLCRYMDAVKLLLPPGKPSARGKRRDPLAKISAELQVIDALTDEQRRVIARMGQSIDSDRHELFLLKGVTGSGKTEVYMQLIQRVAARGRTAIMLVPEISLTKQIIERFAGRFGAENIAVFHSRLSAGERHDEWQRVQRGEAKIVVGARSAVFAPLTNVGIVILDEEHESTYKSDMSPKYDTLEVAIKRTRPVGGIVVMGSATPSVVSYERSRRGIFTKLELKERYNKVQLPRMDIVDMRPELAAGNTSVISRRLHAAMQTTLEKGQQVILFMNRRGYQTFVSCRACGHVMECPKCGISLTYHKGDRQLVCHYCDHREPMPERCPSCGSPYIKGFGTGTEKVVETIEELFPGVKAARLDLDAMKHKGTLEKTLDAFANGDTQVLVGTQVVAKGLDYRNVGLVGIISCDVLLNIPDYRAPERAFQLITQAAGRAGRGDEQGQVIIQTYTPSHYAVQAAAAQDYEAFFEKEMERRRQYGYPPFTDIIQVMFGGRDKRALKEAVRSWRAHLIDAGASAADIVAAGGMEYDRAETEYREYLLIRSLPEHTNMYRKLLMALREQDRQERKAYSIVADVNPYSLWRS